MNFSTIITTFVLHRIKALIFAAAFIFNGNAFAQEHVLSFKNENLSKRLKKDSYSLTNTLNQDLAIVITERNKVFAYLFDADFNQKSSLEIDELKNKYNDVIGYSLEGLKYDVLFSNSLKDKFSILTIDFASQTMTTSEVKIDMSDALYIDAVSYKNNLYLFTTGDDLKLNILAYDKQLNFKVAKTFTFDEVKDKSLLIQRKNKIGSFRLAVAQTSAVGKIDQHTPNSIDLASRPSKLYQQDNKVYLTFDDKDSGTSVYDIDLETFSIDFKSFSYPKGKLDDFKKYNSFIYEDKIFQIGSSKKEMGFTIKNFSGELIKDFYVQDDQPIAFKNSPFIQKGTALPFIEKRELEETKKYLRKISQGDLGITVLKNKEMYYITLGAFNIIPATPTLSPMSISTINPTVNLMNSTGSTVYFNGINLNYNSYIASKSIYFNAIFDSNFNHLKGTIEDNLFDTIKTYQDSLKYSTAEDVFFHNDTVFIGYFNLIDSEYKLIKF